MLVNRYLVSRGLRTLRENVGVTLRATCARLIGASVRGARIWSLLPGVAQWDAAEKLWRDGNMSAAIATARRRQRERFSDEAELLRHPPQPSRYGTGGTAPLTQQAPKVLYVVNNAQPIVTSGYTHRTQFLVSALHDHEVDTIVLCRPPFPATFHTRSAGTEWTLGTVQYCVGNVGLFHPRRSVTVEHAAQVIADTAQRHGCTVIQATTDWQNGLPALLAARRLGLPFIYEMRGELENTWVSRYPEQRRSEIEASERYRLLRDMEAHIAACADHVLCLSEIQKESVIDRGVAAERITVVPNGADLPTGEISAAYSAAEDTMVFGTVSSLVAYEGIDLLLDVLVTLRQQQHKAHLVVVGDGPEFERLLQRATDLGVRDACTFPGRVPQSETWRWYQAIDVLCVPRIAARVTRTVTPLKTIPALALGKPVLVADLPALREITPPTHRDRWVVSGYQPETWAQAIVAATKEPRPIGEAVDFAATRTWNSSAAAVAQLFT